MVLGLGTSGRSAARFCAERGAHVVAADERPEAELRDLHELGPRIELRCGQPLPAAAELEPFDLLVPSPGVPRERYAERPARLRVWGDIELAYRALPIPIAAVTGTNGKSTTTCLLAALLGSAGLRAAAAGNLGEAALGLVGQPLDVGVLEVSSFQLETIEAFRPTVALILNITPDHLDRHRDLRSYAAAKARILENQHAGDAAVINADDPLVGELASTAKARVFRFSRHRPQERGAWLDGDAVMLRDGASERRIGLESLSIPGRHNRDNAAMALCATMALGADLALAAEALPAFRGLAHRSEFIAEIAGVRYINDSKATNPGAAASALDGLGSRVLWIAGGRDKGLDFAPLADAATACVRTALLIGEASEALDASLPGSIAREHCGTLARAVERAAALAERGDVVLLAPACASFDQFASFAERGEAFRTCVAQLAAAGARS
jgi:UDP-N-acetylmuramoylalanine--D-glutamate ligase